MPASKSKPASQHRVYDQVEDQGHKPNELGDRKRCPRKSPKALYECLSTRPEVAFHLCANTRYSRT